MKSLFLHFSMLVFLIPACIFAQSVSVSGSWYLDLTQADLSDGAGSDLVPTHESAAGVITMNINKSGVGWFTNWDWRIDVSRSDLNWPSEFSLDIRRSSNGFGFGSISGGTSYQEITGSSQAFFYGRRHRIWIGMQLRLKVQPLMLNLTPIKRLLSILLLRCKRNQERRD